jgi:phosphoribosyl-AMP cyclohydrolase
MNVPNFKKRMMFYRSKGGEEIIKGFIIAIIVDCRSKEILMQAFMDENSFNKTVETGFVHFWSFSRDELWFKGETSGNKLRARRMILDCDNDCIKIDVDVLGEGRVCHTGSRSCFFNQI